MFVFKTVFQYVKLRSMSFCQLYIIKMCVYNFALFDVMCGLSFRLLAT